MAAIQGRVVEVRADEDRRYMDPISIKYTNAPPYPSNAAVPSFVALRGTVA